MILNVCFYEDFLCSESQPEFSNRILAYLLQKLLDRFDYDDEPEAVEESKKEDAVAPSATTTPAPAAVVPTTPAAVAAPSVAAPTASPPQAPLYVSFFRFLSR